ncbi:hypothetical protein [Novosphingobium umbonatum]|uniref:hypothetical protein n=1 Tax=Novosphingobium umbonatum TaxID=1908524 RepID=UPI0013E32168|nr:hypothetical protein [Novosphingobium umbonatum]
MTMANRGKNPAEFLQSAAQATPEFSNHFALAALFHHAIAPRAQDFTGSSKALRVA